MRRARAADGTVVLGGTAPGTDGDRLPVGVMAYKLGTMPAVQSGGVPIHYEVIGQGQPIVLVHGFSSSFERNWQRTGWVDFLVGEGRRVIGIDCRGHGMSGKPHSPEAYAGNQIPDDVLAAMDAVGIERADIMGYSMGALVTLNLLSRHAERFSSAVAGGCGLPRPSADPQRRAAMAAALEAADPATISEPTALQMRETADRRGNDLPALAAFHRSERTQADQAALRRLERPLLVVVGGKDELLASARQLVAAVVGAELVTLAGEDHQSTLTARGYKRAVGRFLQARQGMATSA
jgi:pimeloyl-ACP methyl ester carboxylesterase